MRGQKYIFTDEQIKYIVDNWENESIHSMKKKFGCSWYAIANVGQEYGLELPTSNNWTEEEINKLVEYSSKYDIETIAKKMNKTENAVYLKARKLNIILQQSRRKWTENEEREFEELWGTINIESLAKRLKRSVNSLKVKAVRMGLGPMIRNNTDILTIYDIIDILNVSRDRIITWSKIGLNLQKKSVSKERSYYYVTWDDFLNFLKSHQDLWDANKVDLYMLGEEYDWLREKRKKDAKEKPLSYKVWSNLEKNSAVNYFKLGYSYEDIAKLLNRSEWAIKNFLNNNGYYISDRKKWTKEELEYLKENYMSMEYKCIAKELNKTKSSVEYNAYKNGYTKRLKKTR